MNFCLFFCLGWHLRQGVCPRRLRPHLALARRTSTLRGRHSAARRARRAATSRVQRAATGGAAYPGIGPIQSQNAHTDGLILHVEYAERIQEYGILFILSLFWEYASLEYARMHVIYRVSQSEYVICILVAAPQEYVNIYSSRRAAASRVQRAAAGRPTHPGRSRP